MIATYIPLTKRKNEKDSPFTTDKKSPEKRKKEVCFKESTRIYIPKEKKITLKGVFWKISLTLIQL